MPTWDGENRLTAVSKDGVTEEHRYAATGLRRQKGETSYLWDGQNLLAELDEALGTLAQYTDFPGRWGGLSAMRRGGASSFYGYDMSANTRDLLDAAGAAERYLYSAFGPELLAPAGANPYRFGGQVGYYRDEAERSYVRAREYAPGVGRWGSRDPIGLVAGDANPYRYAAGAPSQAQDPTGLGHDSFFGPAIMLLIQDVLVALIGPGAWVLAAYIAYRIVAALLLMRDCMRALDNACHGPCFVPNHNKCIGQAVVDIAATLMGFLPLGFFAAQHIGRAVMEAALKAFAIGASAGSVAFGGLIDYLEADCLPSGGPA